MAEDILDAGQVFRHLLLYKFEDKALTQIKLILMGDQDEIVAVEFVFIQLIEDSIYPRRFLSFRCCLSTEGREAAQFIFFGHLSSINMPS